jgi:hypothetical protein
MVISVGVKFTQREGYLMLATVPTNGARLWLVQMNLPPTNGATLAASVDPARPAPTTNRC